MKLYTKNMKISYQKSRFYKSQITRAKLNLFRVDIYHTEDLKSCDSHAKDNFVRTTSWKFGVIRSFM